MPFELVDVISDDIVAVQDDWVTHGLVYGWEDGLVDGLVNGLVYGLVDGLVDGLVKRVVEKLVYERIIDIVCWQGQHLLSLHIMSYDHI